MLKNYTKYFAILLFLYGSTSAFSCPTLSNSLTAKDEINVIKQFKSHLVDSDINKAGFISSPGAPIPVLHLAAYKGCLDFVKYYVSIHGIKHVSIKNKAHMNVLHIAVDQGHKDIVKFLLENGADPKETIEAVIIFIPGKGFDGAKFLTNVSTLDFAKLKGNKDIVKILENHMSKSWWPF